MTCGSAAAWWSVRAFGDDVVIGAGSVVTKDIPSHSVAVGNPCHVIRKITDADREYWEGKAAEYRAWKDSL